MPAVSTEAPADLNLPVDHYWFEQLLDASIVYDIARKADQAADRDLNTSSENGGLLTLFRFTAHDVLWGRWLEYVEAGKRASFFAQAA